jgi:hypothetical protein
VLALIAAVVELLQLRREVGQLGRDLCEKGREKIGGSLFAGVVAVKVVVGDGEIGELEQCDFRCSTIVELVCVSAGDRRG